MTLRLSTSSLQIIVDDPRTFVKFVNRSKYTIEVSFVPTPPKRKIRTFLIVPEDSFILYEEKSAGIRTKLDITKLYFRFIDETPQDEIED